MKKVKVFNLILISFLCISLFMPNTLFYSAAQTDEAKETLTVGVPTDRTPMFYIDAESGEITGIGIDLMREVASSSGYEVSFIAIQEEDLKHALDNTDYDVILPFGSAIDSANGQPSYVSENLIEVPFTLLTQKGKALPPMNYLRVGMLSSLGGVAETIKSRFPGMEIIKYDTQSDSVAALKAGKVDALLNNSYVWSYVLQKPSYSNLVVQPSAMFSMGFRVGTIDTLEGRALINRLNDGINLLNDTKRQAIVLDHTSRKLYKKTLFDYLYDFGLFLTLGILLIFSIITIIALKLRTNRLEHEENMRRIIDHDPLTGVLSLNGFRKRAKELILSNQDVPYVLSYNNIKDFKFINDSLGRASGDELLKFWTKKSMEVISDEEAIGRLESDHFVILRRIAGKDKLEMDDKTVFTPLKSFFIERGKDINVRMCVGIYVLTPQDYKEIDIDRMIDNARVAEKRIHNSKKEGFEFYNPSQWEKEKRVAEIVSSLPAALCSGELQVWYQPQVNYATGEITGAEALCRWKHSELGFVPPSEFIPALEDAGLIYDLDKYVWNRVCEDLSIWNSQGKRRILSVNVSRYDILRNADIAEYFKTLIDKNELSPDQLRIEITETAYVEDPDILINTTQNLRRYGFLVEMDDFGSGYSSLNMLKEVPVDRIKLDLRFLTGKGDSERGKTIISHVVQMIHSLGMEVIAEGVETEEQALFLKNLGCNEMQGFYFYRPAPKEEFEGRGRK